MSECGILYDRDIEWLAYELDAILPFDRKYLQPASYDLHLSNSVIINETIGRNPFIQPYDGTGNHGIRPKEVTFDHVWSLEPHRMCLASTIEHITVPADLCARFEGKSTLGRYGLMTHVTAGFIDPGFSGTITVELVNVTDYPIHLTKGMPIGQLCFQTLTGVPRRQYGEGGHYQGQDGPTVPYETFKA